VGAHVALVHRRLTQALCPGIAGTFTNGQGSADSHLVLRELCCNAQLAAKLLDLRIDLPRLPAYDLSSAMVKNGMA